MIEFVLPFARGIFLKQPNTNTAHPDPKTKLESLIFCGCCSPSFCNIRAQEIKKPHSFLPIQSIPIFIYEQRVSKVDTYLAQHPNRSPQWSQHCNMPSTKDDVAVYPADSDAWAGVIAMPAELHCSTHCERLFYTVLFQGERAWIKDSRLLQINSPDIKSCGL